MKKPLKQHILTVNMRHRRFDVFEAKLPKDVLGECYKGAHEIRIQKGLRAQVHLDTVLHEALHACFRDATEEAVFETARSLMDLLWRLGYRRCEL